MQQRQKVLTSDADQTYIVKVHVYIYTDQLDNVGLTN